MARKTIALKFGGTSLASAQQFRKVAEIIKGDPARRYVVASAPGKRDSADIKVTDLLYRCFDLALAGEDFEPVLGQIRARFDDIIRELWGTVGSENTKNTGDGGNSGTPAGAQPPDLSADFDAIRWHLRCAPQRDFMASRGEYLNSKILAAWLGFPFVDPALCVCFDEAGILDFEATSKALKGKLSALPCAVVAGFYGRKPDGSIKTFSRGGSDLTGALVAEAAGADLYENWTDVSGMLAADPRIVENPGVIDCVSYRELRILSYMGASVLHTDAVIPVSKAGIPINIRNTNRPEDAGTMIVPKLPEDRQRRLITGVAGRKGMSVVQVEKTMVSDGAGFSAVLLDIFKNHRVPFEQCLTGIDTITVIIRRDLFRPQKDVILQEIREILQPDTLLVEDDLAMITIVGERTGTAVGLVSGILDAVASAGVDLSTVNQGSGDLNLIIGVQETDYEKTIRAVYGMITAKE